MANNYNPPEVDDQRGPQGQQAASYDMIAEIHQYTALMIRNRAKECAETGEWDPSVIANSLKLLNSEGIRAKVTANPLASISEDTLADLTDFEFDQTHYGSEQ